MVGKTISHNYNKITNTLFGKPPSLPKANNESSEVFDIIKPVRRVKI